MKTVIKPAKIKVLVISASPNRENSTSFQLANKVIKGIDRQQADCEIVHLHDHKILFCRHCDKCHLHILDCPVKDDVRVILKKMLDADAIILASPNYMSQIPAILKAVWERASHLFHCKRLLGKYVAGVITSGSGMDQNVLDYIKMFTNSCGAQYSGGVASARNCFKDKSKEAEKLGRELIIDVQDKRICPKQQAAIEAGIKRFSGIIKNYKKEWHEEYLYYQEKGWL